MWFRLRESSRRDGNRLAVLSAMIPRPLHRSALLGLGCVFVLACSAGPTESIGPERHYGGTGSTTGTGGSASNTGGGTSNGPGTGNGTSTSNGDTSGGGSGSSSGGAASASSSGGSGSSSGSSSGGTDAPPASPDFTVAVDNDAPSINLADVTSVSFTITPGKWTGTVALSVTGLPLDLTASWDNPSVTLAESPITAKLTLKSVDSTAPNSTPLQLVATSGSYTKMAAATIGVKSELTISIPVNVSANRPGLGSYTITAPADIKTNPVTINFLNLDSTPHEITRATRTASTTARGRSDRTRRTRRCAT